MKNVVGSPARGGDFFHRPKEVQKIISRIENGNNLQIVAPRRIGKTSILFFLLDNNIHNYAYVYVDTESIATEQDFYKRLLVTICKADCIAKSKTLFALFKAGAKFLSKIKTVKILGNELNFDDTSDDTNYYEELRNLLSGIELDDNKKLVLLIDEFPQTIVNIIEADKGDTKKAVKFLQSNRELRHDPAINLNVKFIYTGSIGLNHTVSSINATAFINDVSAVEIDPLSYDEGIRFIEELCVQNDLKMDTGAEKYLLEKIEWLIPFHIQLAMQEIISISYDTKTVDAGIVKLAFDNILAARNNNHFEHYSTRLKSQFGGPEYKYVSELLQEIANAGTISKAKLYDMAAGLGLETSYRRIVDVLVYDGYINDNSSPGVYRFNSPIVRMWWQKYICE